MLRLLSWLLLVSTALAAPPPGAGAMDNSG